MKFRVNYSLDVNYDIIVEADSDEEALDMVSSGNFDPDEAILCGEDILCVNSAVLVKS